MNKRNIMILATMAIMLMGSVMLSADGIQFVENNKDTAKNIQGQLYIYNHATEQFDQAGSGYDITVTLFYDLAHGGGVFQTLNLVTDVNSYYKENFTDPNNNYQYCDKIKVQYFDRSYTTVNESYDGTVCIDIYHTPPVYDPNDPNNQ